MIRTQICLTKEQTATLNEMSKVKDLPKAEIIRRALDEYFDKIKKAVSKWEQNGQ